MRKASYWIILIFIAYILFEVSLLCVLTLLKKFCREDYTPILAASVSEKHKEIISKLLNNEKKYVIYSSMLGWTIKENGLLRVKKNGLTYLYRANSRGVRANKEYSIVPSQNIIRISSFGDSFTHCNEVSNIDTWQEKMQKVHSNLEVINFGVGGFGLDQAFLRYKHDGVSYNSHIVFIGFMSENINRSVNIYRPFYLPYAGIPLTKPRFIIQNDQLVLIENPMRTLSHYKSLLAHPEVILPKLGDNDYFFQTRWKESSFDVFPSVRLVKLFIDILIRNISHSTIIRNSYYNKDSEAFGTTIKLFDKFYNTGLRNDSLPIIILFPSRSDLIRYRENKTKKYTPLLEYFNSIGYQYIDLFDAFDTYGKDFEIDALFNKESGHYSPLANELVAKYILYYLHEKNLTNLATIKQRLQVLSEDID